MVGVSGESYRLYSMIGVISGCHSGKYMTVCDHAHSIPLSGWRESSMVKIDDVESDPSCLESCNCTLSECSVPTTVISVDSDENLEPAVSGMWLQTPLYELTKRGKGDDTFTYWLAN